MPPTSSRTPSYAFALLVRRLATVPYAFLEFVTRAASFTSLWITIWATHLS